MKKYITFILILVAVSIHTHALYVPVDFGFDLNLTTNDITESSDRLFVTAAEKLAIGKTVNTAPSNGSNLVVVERGQSIQLAINMMLAGNSNAGGTVFVNPGIFVGNLSIPSGVSLVGSGIGVTTVKQPDGSNENVVTVLNSNNWSISNLTIDGNKINNPTGDNGLVIFGGNHFKVSNVESKDNKLKGMVIAADVAHVEDGLFEYNDTHDNGQDGGPILASGTITSGFKCRRIAVIGNKAHHNIQYGIAAVTPDTFYAQVEDSIFDGNTAYSNGTYGMEFKGGYKLKIINNTSYLNGYHGLNLGLHTHAQFKVRASIVANNQVYNNSKALAGYAGLNRQYMEYTLVEGNIVFDDQSPNSQKGLTDSGNNGSTNVVVNNIVYNNLP